MKVEPLKPMDLQHVYFRAGDETLDAATASHRDFDTWIRSRLYVIGGFSPWSQSERLKACNQLWLAGKLAMPTEEARQELEK